ncbi:hypothetical protein [Chitinophaga vietnamensis]|uniref:hypothetical protein n=1 Tax=Chitinophaga vietnamensis TaxID=2593957 RepID=UPI001177923D|nr:hypothetical protein [Chitinophaga vietnamensis]
MAYGNYNRGYNSYPRTLNRSYSRGSYSQRQNKKHSGCKSQNGWVSRKTGERVDDLLLKGWNYSRRRGMISFVAVPRKERDTANPNYEHWVVSVSASDGRKTFTGFYNVAKRILVIPDLRMVANPNAPNGGYFGRFFKGK